MRSLLSSQETISHLPAFLAALEAGDLRELAVAAVRWRSAPAPPASVFAARCASGASPARLARIERESRTGDARRDDDLCRRARLPRASASGRCPTLSAPPSSPRSPRSSSAGPSTATLRRRMRSRSAAASPTRSASGSRARPTRCWASRTPRRAARSPDSSRGGACGDPGLALAPIAFERPEAAAAGSSLTLASEETPFAFPRHSCPPLLERGGERRGIRHLAAAGSEGNLDRPAQEPRAPDARGSCRSWR